jgi:hypothetical protein
VIVEGELDDDRRSDLTFVHLVGARRNPLLQRPSLHLGDLMHLSACSAPGSALRLVV